MNLLLEFFILVLISASSFLCYCYYRRKQFFASVLSNKKSSSHLVFKDFNFGLGTTLDFIKAIKEKRAYNIFAELLQPAWDMSNKIEFNEVFVDTLFLRRSIGFFDPISFKHLFITKALKFSKGDNYSALKLALGEGLLTSEGEIWKKQRGLLNTVFTTANIRKMNKDMKQLTLQFIKQLQSDIAISSSGFENKSTTIQFEKKMSELTLRIVTAAVFGDELSFASKMAELWSRVAENILPFMLRCDMIPFYRYLPVPSNLALKRDVEEITTLTHSIIKMHQEKIEKEDCLDSNGLYHSKDGKCYLMPLLLTIKDSTGKHIPTQQIIDESLISLCWT